MPELTEQEFKKISKYVYGLCGINLHDGKKELVQARLNKRLRKLGFNSFGRYIKYVQNDETRRELTEMINALSTNQTSFFRENHHFDFLRKEILPHWQTGMPRRRRIWCAGCSSGEEAYTVSIVLNDELSRYELSDTLILASDISTSMLGRGISGVYAQGCFKEMNKITLQKHFDSVHENGTRRYRVKPGVQSLIRFRLLNLMEHWPMQGLFDVILCRNVMIYFDRKTQENVINRFFERLAPGGFLFVGHSESLHNMRHKFKQKRPTIYQKPV